MGQAGLGGRGQLCTQDLLKIHKTLALPTTAYFPEGHQRQTVVEQGQQSEAQ